jgi:hypothetical protein
MRNYWQIISGLLFILSTASCGFQGLTSSLTPSALDDSSHLSLQQENSTPLPSSPLTVPISDTTSSSASAASNPNLEWATYHEPKGVSIEYPATYEVHTFPWDYVRFDPPAVDSLLFEANQQFSLEVYHRPITHRETANPYSWVPNEGGAEVHWGTPITIEGAEGWLFVWGTSMASQTEPSSALWAHTPPVSLMAIYYSEAHELDVRLSVSFDDESTLLAQEIGLAETVAQRYPIFEHMMKSVRFVEPTPISDTTSSSASTASIPTLEWATYHDPKGVSIEYPATYEVHTFPWDYVRFDPPAVDSPLFEANQQFSLEVYYRPITHREIANPYSWVPNEGGAEVHWGTPLTIEGAEGWLFVGGASAEGRLDIESGLWAHTPPVSLMAIYYSEAHELDVRLSVSFDDESTLLAQEIGLAETVAQRYPTFEHMMKSVRFVEPTQP